MVNYKKSMKETEFDKWADDYLSKYDSKGRALPEVVSRGNIRSAPKTAVVGHAPQGWRGEPIRHDLARRGIKTGRKSRDRTPSAQSPYYGPTHETKSPQVLFVSYKMELDRDIENLKYSGLSPQEQERIESMAILALEKILSIYEDFGIRGEKFDEEGMSDVMRYYRAAIKDPNKMLDFYFVAGNEVEVED